ncbi:7998_t:CDS:2 [Ambispora gerdemannii]|uniref:7998_t:CDS:1 n=1 Tax=Ambispora gerdemannii TaxID=144530 RepID=A0A9N9B3T6_9GLOM|nr:7998_t:CDS:2 [Ambispora gerdemannii]
MSTSSRLEQKPNEDKPYIFINSLSPIFPSQVEVQVNTTHTSPQPFFKVPFPPTFSIDDLISNPLSRKSKGNKKPPEKPPNAFIIYRRAFVKAAREEGYRLPMTMISSMASKSWNLEPEEVKKAYKCVAKNARKEYKIQAYNKLQASGNRGNARFDNEVVEEGKLTTISSLEIRKGQTGEDIVEKEEVNLLLFTPPPPFQMTPVTLPSDQSSVVLDFDQDSNNTIAQYTNTNATTAETISDEYSKEISSNMFKNTYCTPFNFDLNNFL